MNINAQQANLAVHKVIVDLLSKGHSPFLPTGEYGLPCDMIVITSCNRTLRLQVKHAKNGFVTKHRKLYTGSQVYVESDFDYYALYLPEVDVVFYPSLKFAGITIAQTIRKTDGPFWWYQDFLEFTDEAATHTGREMGADFSHKNMTRSERKPKPSKEQMQEWVAEEISLREMARRANVSDVSIKTWLRKYNLAG